MSYILKFCGDCKSVSLIIMVLDPAEIECRLFWLTINNRSNDKSCHEYRCNAFRVGIVSTLVLDRIHRCETHPLDSVTWSLSVCHVQRNHYAIALLFSILQQYTKRRQRRTNSRTQSAPKKCVDSGTESDKCKESALSALRKGMTCPLFLVVCPHKKLQNSLIISMLNTFKDHIIVSLFHLVIMSIWWSMTWTPPCRPLTIIFIFLVASCSCWFWSSCSPMSPWNDELHRGQIYGNFVLLHQNIFLEESCFFTSNYGIVRFF